MLCLGVGLGADARAEVSSEDTLQALQGYVQRYQQIDQEISRQKSKNAFSQNRAVDISVRPLLPRSKAAEKPKVEVFSNNKAVDIAVGTQGVGQHFRKTKAQRSKSTPQAVFRQREAMDITVAAPPKPQAPVGQGALKQVSPVKKKAVPVAQPAPEVVRGGGALAALAKLGSAAPAATTKSAAMPSAAIVLEDSALFNIGKVVPSAPKPTPMPKPAPTKTKAPATRVVAKAATVEQQKEQEKEFSDRFIKAKAPPEVEAAKEKVKVVIAPPMKLEPKIPAVLKVVAPPVRPALPAAVAPKRSLDKPEVKAVPAKTPAQKDAVMETAGYRALPVAVVTSTSGPALKLSGDACSFLGVVLQDDTRDNKHGDAHMGFGWADLAMEISGATGGDFKYRYSVNLEIVPASGAAVTENYLEVESKFGTLLFGNLKGPDGQFCAGAESLLGGTGGIDGSCWDLLNVPAGLPSSKQLAGYTKRATKLVYYTARYFGFQAGIGYCPNPHHIGWDALGSGSYADSNSNDDGLFQSADMKRRNNIAFGLNFEQNINENLSCKAAVVAVHEQGSLRMMAHRGLHESKRSKIMPYLVDREIPLHRDTSFQVTGGFKFKNFEMAAGMIENGKLNLPKTAQVTELLRKHGLHTGDSGRSFNVGGKYSVGALEFGIAHHYTTRNATGFNSVCSRMTSVTADLVLVNGVILFVELNHFNGEANDVIAGLYQEQSKPAKNTGTVLQIGTKVSF